MKRLRLLLILCCCVLCLSAQDFDLQSLQQRDLSGSARYVGMAGAMTAVGGDESAVADNPASLGVMRHSGVYLTAGFQTDITGRERRSRSTIGLLPNVGLVLSLRDRTQERFSGVISNNLMIGYTMLKNYSRLQVYEGMSTSMVDMVADITTDNPYSKDILDSEAPFDDANLGWLSVLFAKKGLITRNDDGSWQPTQTPGGYTQQQLNIEEWGANSLYSFSWAMNISNRWFVGLSANVVNVQYNKNTRYTEPLLDYQLMSSFRASGVGVQGNIGLIYHPVLPLRIGLSFASPALMTMNINNFSDIYAADGRSSEISTPYNSYTLSRYTLPMRSTAGLAYQFGQRGLLSVEYDYVHQFERTIADTHTFKVGGEWVIGSGMYLRAGYAYEREQRREVKLVPGYSQTRTDTEFRYSMQQHYATAGFGFRGDFIIVELAYRYRWSGAPVFTHFYQTEPYMMRSQTHGAVLTIGWHG